MKANVLVAEGDVELCRIFDRFLTKHGYQVATAVDGLECVAHLQEAEPSVLVLDHKLCWGGGDGVLAWLREGSAAADVRVILTATVGCPEDSRGLEAPVVHFLPKPFALMSLLECVRNAFAHKEPGERSRRDRAGDSEPVVG